MKFPVLDGWNTVDDVFESFHQDAAGRRILFATRTYGDYSGRACVIFRNRENQLFMIEASHCSCYGFEDQWHPSTITKDAIRLMLSQGWVPAKTDSSNFVENLRQWAEEEIMEVDEIESEITRLQELLAEKRTAKREALLKKREDLTRELDRLDDEIREMGYTA